MARTKASNVPLLADSFPQTCQVNIDSTWRHNLPQKTSKSVETEAGSQRDVATQSIKRRQVATQTHGNHLPSQAPHIGASILPFVERAAGIALEEAARVQEEYEILEPLQREFDDSQEPPDCLYELSTFNTLTESLGSMGFESLEDARAASPAIRSRNRAQRKQNRPAPRKLVVTSLSWSSTGQTIAAAYGRLDVKGWCTDRGAIATWNLARERVNQQKPDAHIDVDVSVTTCSFHPEHPALIAAGTFNGDLCVYDLSQDGDKLRGRSDTLGHLRHQEPISSIAWEYNLTEAGKYGSRDKAYRLVTMGADGKILVWLWHKPNVPVYGFQLLWPAPGMDLKVLWGGTSMSFVRAMLNPKHSSGTSKALGSKYGDVLPGGNTFIAGTEGGHIFRCFFEISDISTKEFQKALAAEKEVDLRCPVKDSSFVHHAGPVYGVDCSPFQRDVFLSCSSDGNVRLYHTLQQQPLLSLEPTASQLFAGQWSPSRPLVFATAGDDGRVFIYDLLRASGVIRPSLVMEAGRLVGSPTYAMAFNARKPGLLATGDAAGVKVWKLPENLWSSRRGEEAILRKMATVEDASEFLRERSQQQSL